MQAREAKEEKKEKEKKKESKPSKDKVPAATTLAMDNDSLDVRIQKRKDEKDAQVPLSLTWLDFDCLGCQLRKV